MSQRFDDDEQELLASFERDEWQSTPNLADELAHYRQYAAATIEQLRSVRIQLAADDFARLQQQAKAAGLSPETFLEQIAHQYMAGELVKQS